MNIRRKLVLALGAGTFTAPFAARAQSPPATAGKIWRVGFLASPGRPVDLDAHYYGAFKHGMRELGYVEGKNLIIEWRWAGGDTKRLAGLAAELLAGARRRACRPPTASMSRKYSSIKTRKPVM